MQKSFDKLNFITAGMPLSTGKGSYPSAFEVLKDLNLDGMELEFVHGVRMSDEHRSFVSSMAKDFVVTAHGPFYINLNSKEDDKIEGLEHYYDPKDFNQVIYHQRQEDYASRLAGILSDADSLMKKCSGGYDGVPEYQLLVRAFTEQVFVEEDGSLRLKTAEDGEMNSTILQNPSDPDAAYREKAGKQHRGYSANITESVGEGNSVVTDYQYDQNIHSDSDFLKEHLDATEKSRKEQHL